MQGRKDLIAKLIDSVRRHGVTVVVAPIGYDKTAVAMELAAALGKAARIHPETPVRHTDHNRIGNGKTIVPSTTAALMEDQSCVPRKPPTRQLDADRPARANDSPRHAAVSAGETGRRKGLGVVHIVDNYRPDTSSDPCAAAKAGAPCSSLIVFSRSRPDEIFAESSGNDVVVFTSEALSFSENETREYLESVGINDDEAAAKIIAVGEGWPAAVRLAAKSWRDTGDARLSPEMESVLVGSLLADYSGFECATLLRLAAMESFSLENVRALAGENGVAWFKAVFDLHSLAFHDKKTGTYRLRRIVRSFLEKEAADASNLNLPALHRQAAVLSAENGDLIGAFRLYVRAGRIRDLFAALALFLEPGADRMCALHADELLAAVHSIPLPIRQRQSLGYLAFIRLFLSTRNDMPLAEWRLAEIDAGLSRLKKSRPDLVRRVKGEIAVITGILASDNAMALWSKFKEAHELLQGHSQIHPDLLTWHAGCPQLSFACLHRAGEYERLVKQAVAANETLRALTRESCGDCAGTLAAEYHLERGECHLARKQLEKMDGAAEGAATTIPLALARTRLFLLEGNVAAAQAIIKTLRLRMAESGDDALAESVDLASGYLGAVIGNADLIPGWLENGVAQALPHVASWKLPFFFAVYGKALLMAGDFGRLGIVAKTAQERLRTNGSLLGRIHASVLEAISLRHQQGTKKAQQPLLAALELSRADGLALSIAEYGGLAVPILRAMKKEHGSDRHFKHVLSLAEKYRELGIGREAARDTVLSFREQEKMRMVVKGLSNEAIGKELGITANAVRKSLIQVYTKLGANNRTQATHLFTLRNRQRKLNDPKR